MHELRQCCAALVPPTVSGGGVVPAVEAMGGSVVALCSEHVGRSLTPCTSKGIAPRYRTGYRTQYRTMYEHTNSVLTAQPHWATTGNQKGALGASRAAWRVAIDATLVSFEAPA